MIVNRGGIFDPRRIPIGEVWQLRKSDTYLGPEYKETDLGYQEGAIRQFRGPNGVHIHEYDTYYAIHRDNSDPERDPLGHAIMDSPEVVIGATTAGIAGSAVGKAVYDRRKDESDHPVAEAVAAGVATAIISGAASWFLTKTLRESQIKKVRFSGRSNRPM